MRVVSYIQRRRSVHSSAGVGHICCFWCHRTFDTAGTFPVRARVFGVSGGALDWMGSFVTGRSQFITVGSETSDTIACSSGFHRAQCLAPDKETRATADSQSCHQHTPTWSHYSGTRRSALAAGAVSDRVQDCTDHIPGADDATTAVLGRTHPLLRGS